MFDQTRGLLFDLIDSFSIGSCILSIVQHKVWGERKYASSVMRNMAFMLLQTFLNLQVIASYIISLDTNICQQGFLSLSHSC